MLKAKKITKIVENVEANDEEETKSKYVSILIKRMPKCFDREVNASVVSSEVNGLAQELIDSTK